ncbi:uncharacterized protein (UPF0303 family) [Motilibacter rhizosphaerae]|uniref:UPF0303 protein EV189_2217 n=1 Tax=Motilibacter rhizosphaerae TaxID=598652 RepID=A0A4Q7NNJ1_9ACTN|nr:heme-degrading domain-containing protein [Motilibacter rhizosphaerae]RZS86801.1 uncharacterized protein (UPF0303 family) [Motilibacter rhizosphaerae]
MTSEPLTPDTVLSQERELVLPSLSNDDAVDLGLELLRLARERALPVLIEVRRGPQVLFRAALPGVVPDNDVWVAGKTRVVERYGHATLYHRLVEEESGVSFTERNGLDFADYRAHGGGFPLAVAGTGVVGVAVVSGLPQREDHALVVEALRAHLASRG